MDHGAYNGTRLVRDLHLAMQCGRHTKRVLQDRGFKLKQNKKSAVSPLLVPPQATLCYPASRT